MFDGTHFERGLCDRCDHRENAYSDLAHELLGPGVLENNHWVGGYTQEKASKWNAALAEAEKRLTKLCVVIWGDCENIRLCRGCVERLLQDFPIDEKST